ncbi:MAG: VOC family protein [Bacteroidales bacterium]|nr:VOC family protein [Bacteroidales bacterium]
MNNKYFISGIQQVGVGCENFHESWKWYIEMFNMDVRILEDDTVAERMLPYTGGKAQKRHACIAVNLQGGGGFEIWQYSDRKPCPASFDISVGDLGIFAAKIKSCNIEQFHRQLCGKYNQVGPLSTSPDGRRSFIVKDPWNNYFQVVEDSYVFIKQPTYNGGVVGAMIGCSDIDKALPLYRDLLGYDRVVYDVTSTFDDIAYMKEGAGKYRRVLLAESAPRKGAFAPLYGAGNIELVQSVERAPRKIYEGRYWGDPGFIQLCLDVTNMRALEKRCEAAGYPFTVDSCKNDDHFDMGEASGHFTYIEDPDGTLIELVEAHKLTVSKRPHIVIDMLSRNREKPFPKFFFRLMALNRVKF